MSVPSLSPQQIEDNFILLALTYGHPDRDTGGWGILEFVIEFEQVFNVQMQINAHDATDEYIARAWFNHYKDWYRRNYASPQLEPNRTV